MSTAIVLQTSPFQAELHERRAELLRMRALLTEREMEIADLRSTLRSFEGVYLREVGALYAELDEWEARIAEREVALYDSDDARQRAHEARRRAFETHEAAYGEARDAEVFDPPASLKGLFREVAKRIHPDFARDEAEREHCTRLMVRANSAYLRGDAEALQRILDDFHEVSADTEEGPEAELSRIARQLQHAHRDIALLDEELAILPSGEIAQLKTEADAARTQGRDLIAELAAGLRERVAAVQQRFATVDRQIKGHGK